MEPDLPLQKTFDNYTVRISKVTLNESQRRFKVLAQKEAEGWHVGSIHFGSFLVCTLSSRLTLDEIIQDACNILNKHGVELTSDDFKPRDRQYS